MLLWLGRRATALSPCPVRARCPVVSATPLSYFRGGGVNFVGNQLQVTGQGALARQRGFNKGSHYYDMWSTRFNTVRTLLGKTAMNSLWAEFVGWVGTFF